MDILGIIISFTILGSLVSLGFGVFLLFHKQFPKSAHYLSAFAAGALLGAAFFDLLPEAFEAEPNAVLFTWVLAGIIGFFILERFIHWFHHHHDIEKTKDTSLVSLVIIGDTIHNFIDGAIIAGTFMINIPLGIVTTFAVAAHEIPQEIGDFGILASRGLKKSKIILINLISGMFAVLGALLAYFAGENLQANLPILLALASGFFIYIALSDLVPEIHNQEKRKVALIETVCLIVGLLTIWFFVQIMEGGH